MSDEGSGERSEEDAAQVANVWTIVRYLARHPDEFGGLLTVARMEEERLTSQPGGLDFEGITPVDAQSVASARRRVEAYIQSGLFRACSRCFERIVLFADGEKIDWPIRSIHRCDGGGDPNPAPRRQGRSEPRAGGIRV